jgi:hypothetical protein
MAFDARIYPRISDLVAAITISSQRLELEPQKTRGRERARERKKESVNFLCVCFNEEKFIGPYSEEALDQSRECDQFWWTNLLCMSLC